MRLIHLSDIHFGGYGPGWDPDEDQRRELWRDIERLVEADGPVDGVLVGGDIAFRASKSDYDRASEWLTGVVDRGGCHPSQVWVVPGNHDLDRNTHTGSPSRQAMINTLRGTELEVIDQEILKWLKDPSAAANLACFDSYNEFADQWLCPTSASSPHWTDMTLALDGLDVYLTGLNSALFSDTVDDPSNGPVLPLGTLQCELPRANGRVHIAFGHHPPNWIRDWPQVEPYLRRAHLLLYGHEHMFKAMQATEGGTVEVFAGAVGPDRTGAPDSKYAPSWNLISLGREGEEHLAITIEPRVWFKSLTRFDRHPDGLSDFRVQVDLEARPATTDVQPPDAALEHAGANPSPLIPDSTEVFEGVTLPSSTDRTMLRDLGLRFMRLAPTRRLELAQDLGVAAGLADSELDPGEVGREVLRRIRQADKIDDLARMLNDA